jgi:hypothetical protein
VCCKINIRDVFTIVAICTFIGLEGRASFKRRRSGAKCVGRRQGRARCVKHFAPRRAKTPQPEKKEGAPKKVGLSARWGRGGAGASSGNVGRLPTRAGDGEREGGGRTLVARCVSLCGVECVCVQKRRTVRVCACVHHEKGKREGETTLKKRGRRKGFAAQQNAQRHTGAPAPGMGRAQSGRHRGLSSQLVLAYACIGYVISRALCVRVRA